MNQSHSPVVPPRFASVGGGYDALLAPPIRQPRLTLPDDHRRCSSVTCSSTGSSYLERRGSAMAMPCLPPPPSFPRHAYDEPWDLYYPIDIQVDPTLSRSHDTSLDFLSFREYRKRLQMSRNKLHTDLSLSLLYNCVLYHCHNLAECN